MEIEKCIIYATLKGTEKLLKVMSNEYQDKNEKYETDMIELSDPNFISQWYDKDSKYYGQNSQETFKVQQGQKYKEQGRRFCYSYLKQS